MSKSKGIANRKQLEKYSLEQLEAEIKAHSIRLNSLSAKVVEYSQRVEKLDTKGMPLEKKEELGLADIKHKTTLGLHGMGGKVKGIEKGHLVLKKETENNKNSFETDVGQASKKSDSIKRNELIKALISSVSAYNAQEDKLNKFNSHLAEFDSPNDVKSKLDADLQKIEEYSIKVGARLKIPNTPKEETLRLEQIQTTLYELKNKTTRKNNNLLSAVNDENRLRRLPSDHGLTQLNKIDAEKNTRLAVTSGNKWHATCNKKLNDVEKKLPELISKGPVASVVAKAQDEVKKEQNQQEPIKETTPLTQVCGQFKAAFVGLTTDKKVTELLEKIKPQLDDIENYKKELSKGDAEAQAKAAILQNLVNELRQSKTMDKVTDVVEKLNTAESGNNSRSNYEILSKPRGFVYELLGWKPTSAGLVDALTTAIKENNPNQEQGAQYRR